MTPPGTFERVYGAIRDRLRGGTYKPGSRLEPAILSEELNASVTPVRDALHRLTGERLIEAPRHEGFRVPLVTETSLRHLYAWHRDLLTLALLNRARAPSTPTESEQLDDSDQIERQNGLFFTIASLTGNPEHLIALEALTHRLEPVQRIEGALLDAVEEETDAIEGALRAGDRRQLRRALVHYHRRRTRIVPELLERLYRHEQH
jgi:DNA-binding GntR family transcriptional regulator